MGISRIRGPADAEALAARLNGNERARPIALVSTPASSEVPWIDVEGLAAEFGPLVDVYLITTGPDTWSLTNALPTGTQVYGGAGRVYPVGHEWTRNLSRSPLRFAFDTDTGRRATRKLVSDGLGMAAVAGLLKARPAQPPTRAIGIVKGLPTPDRAIVEMPNRLMATIAQELTLPDIPLDRVLAKGMQVPGLLDTAQKRFDICEAIRPVDAVSYEVGRPVPAVVTDVHADSARFELFPELQVLVSREAITSNENDDLRSLFTVGEVTMVRVSAGGPDWALSLIDIDDDEVPERAPSIIEGGPPWVTPPPPPEPWVPLAVPEVELSEPEALPLQEPDIPEVVPEPEGDVAPTSRDPGSGPSPLLLGPKRHGDVPPVSTGPASAGVAEESASRPVEVASSRAMANQLHNAIASAKAEVKAAHQKLQALQAERDLIASRLSHAHAEVTGLKSEAKRLRTTLRKKSRIDPQHASLSLTQAFEDPEAQFRHDIYSTWVKRIPASEKESLPLRDFLIGPAFLDSLEEVEGVKTGKVHDVVVEVLTELVRRLPGRELHRLRTSESGNSPPTTRGDGAVAWRVSLQVGSPSARRLHYWQLPDGSIELAKVCLHDDVTM